MGARAALRPPPTCGGSAAQLCSRAALRAPVASWLPQPTPLLPAPASETTAPKRYRLAAAAAGAQENLSEFRLTYHGLEASEAYLEQVVAEQGPFDGLIGFSQGAIMAAALAAMQRTGAALRGAPPLKFVILFGAAFSEHPRHQEAFFRNGRVRARRPAGGGAGMAGAVAGRGSARGRFRAGGFSWVDLVAGRCLVRPARPGASSVAVRWALVALTSRGTLASAGAACNASSNA